MKPSNISDGAGIFVDAVDPVQVLKIHMSNQSPSRVLIISHDVIGSRMAGTGIRYWEMARVLAKQQPVTLIAPQPSDLQPPDFRLGHYAWGDSAALGRWLAEADLVVANGYLLQPHPELAAIAQPLALDLYDPILLENLELGRTAPISERTARTREDVLLLNRQLATGDFFLCATERQRDLYIGALMGAGRISPEQIDTDPELRRLIDVVPFGLPATPPRQQAPALRETMPGIGRDDLILLWSGGLWDWLDPLTLIRAMPEVIARHPATRLVFLAGAHPGNVAVMRRADEAKALATELGLTNSHIFFYEQWVLYERRADFLLDADIAVSLHHQHLETAYAAVRSRFLDHLWAGLPSVVSDGDGAADLVRRHRLGIVVSPNDTRELATALTRFISDRQERADCAGRARSLATTMTWEQCLPPLIAWCRAAHHKEPRMSTSRSFAPGDQPQSPAAVDAERNNILAALDSRWHIREPSISGGLLAPIRRFLIQQFVRPFVVPLLERQNEYNDATTKALYALAESSDHRRSATQAQMVGLWTATNQAKDRLQSLTQDIVALEQHTLDLDDADTALAEALLLNGSNALPKEPGP